MAPVDAVVMHEGEASAASEARAWLSFWCWYLPSEEIRFGHYLRVMPGIAARWRALFRSPLSAAPIRAAAAKIPVRR